MTFSNLGKFVVVTALVVSTALVFAQGGGGGGGRGGGGGGFGGGQRGGFGGGFGAGVHNLANRADVQRDIKATEDQKTKIAALNETMREEMRGAFGGFGGGGGERPDMNAIRTAMEKMNEKGKTELAKILDAGQMKRIDEIQIQLAGANALLLPAVQKALGLSPDQISKLTALQQKQQEANMSIMEKQRNQEISREEAQAAREKNTKALADEFNKVLTPEQQDKFKGMAGAPFKADPPQGRGGGGL